MSEMKTVVAGEHPVPMAENSRRYIDKEPVTVDLQGAHGAYYARRMMSGELVELTPQQAEAARKKLAADQAAAVADQAQAEPEAFPARARRHDQEGK